MSDIKLLKKLFKELIREESRGKRFFSDAARFVKDPKAKRLFEYLALEETRHLDVLNAIWKARLSDPPAIEKKKLTGTHTEVIEYAGSAQPVFYLQDKPMSEIDIPEFELFKADDFQEILEDASLESILKFAMKIEFENSKYIVGFMKYLQNREYIDLLKKLADDEKEHFIALKKLLEGLKKKLA